MASSRKTKSGHLALTGEMTIYEAAALKSQMLASLNASQGLEVDLSGVTELDTSGVQLMLLLKHEAEVANKSLKWVKHSQPVSQVLTLLNLVAPWAIPYPSSGVEHGPLRRTRRPH